MSDINTVSPPKGLRPAPVALTWVVLGVAWGAFLLPQAGTGLLVGWPLNLVAFCLAIVILVRGRTVAGILAMVASVVVSPLIYLLGLLLLLLANAFSNVDIDIQESGPVYEHHGPPAPVETPSLQMTARSPGQREI
ncbi:hypothetical protein [Kushneria marisflavi]|uniref:Uncharacterized protein n=1 Tax=Kushneria marisflavi TaxID=157779 RepID=A0A240UP11_9GAMM|nr:hypothetical protein [Kushneria marisflavi]ART62760.1 hypothetical protein B9H00_06590 [Kushneria marisflavi]RKD83831.1 hypothetical protein C8D96_2685 [Kushneria marisflavi]